MKRLFIFALYLCSCVGVGYSLGYGREFADYHYIVGLICFFVVLSTLPAIILGDK